MNLDMTGALFTLKIKYEYTQGKEGASDVNIHWRTPITSNLGPKTRLENWNLGWELTSTWKSNNIDIFWNLKFSHFSSIQIDLFELKNWFLIGRIFIPFNQNNKLNIIHYVIDIT